MKGLVKAASRTLTKAVAECRHQASECKVSKTPRSILYKLLHLLISVDTCFFFFSFFYQASECRVHFVVSLSLS